LADNWPSLAALFLLLHRANKPQMDQVKTPVTIAILGVKSGLYHDVVAFSFLHSISLASLLFYSY